MLDVVGRWWWRLLKLGFRLLYNEMAFTYDWVSWIVSVGQWRCWQRTVFKHLPEDVFVLELAHGTGDLQIDLHEAGYRSVGYDLSPYMGRIARRKLQRLNMDAKLARGYAETMPFANEAFGAVVSTFPTPFIIERETVTEIYRVLKPGGRLIVVPSGLLTGNGLRETALEWLYDVTGQREGDMGEFAGAFRQAGFDVEIVYKTCPHSVVIVLVAQKPNL